MKIKYIITLVLVGLLVGCKDKAAKPEDSGVKTIQPQEFSPTSIAGLKIWFKADALPAITDGTPIAIGGTNREFTAGTMPFNTFHTQSFSFDSSMRSGYINGTSVYSNNTVSGVVTYSGVPAFMLGMRSATAVGEFLTGDIAEVLYYSSALSLADMQKIETYLKSKYAHY